MQFLRQRQRFFCFGYKYFKWFWPTFWLRLPRFAFDPLSSATAIFHLPFSIFRLSFNHCAHFPVNYSAHCCQLSLSNTAGNLVQFCGQDLARQRNTPKSPQHFPYAHTHTDTWTPTQTAHLKFSLKFSRNSFENYSYFRGDFSFSYFPQNEIFCSLTKRGDGQKKNRKKFAQTLNVNVGVVQLNDKQF